MWNCCMYSLFKCLAQKKMFLRCKIDFLPLQKSCHFLHSTKWQSPIITIRKIISKMSLNMWEVTVWVKEGDWRMQHILHGWSWDSSYLTSLVWLLSFCFHLNLFVQNDQAYKSLFWFKINLNPRKDDIDS